jgi:hypothetical protein
MSRRERHEKRREVSLTDSGVTAGDLGPGDFGFRTRPGATGLDPFETRLEMGRFHGTVIAAAFGSRPIRSPRAALAALVAGILTLAAVAFVAADRGPAFLILMSFLVVAAGLLAWKGGAGLIGASRRP